MAHEAAGGRVPLRVRGRRVAQALLGRRDRERERSRRHRRQREGTPRGDRRRRGHEGGFRQLGAVPRSMIERGPKGVCLVVGDRCAGLVATVNSMLPDAGYQRCMVYFMRNVLSKTPPSHREWASAALKAVFAMESRESALVYFVKLRWTCSALNLNTVGGWFLVLLFVWFIS